MEKRILITGASGFIGSFIVEEALRRGLETWAAVRKNSPRTYLQDPRIHFIELDFADTDKLYEQLKDTQFDYIVHAAGVTKCADKHDFYKVNTEGTAHFVKAVHCSQTHLKRFVFLSSLSVFGAIREEMPYEDIKETDKPRPNTDYGKSKLKAEAAVRKPYTVTLKDVEGEAAVLQTLPYVILRPTGVYGPREKDYFLMAKSIKQHVDFSVGFKQQDITFVYVDDVVQAVFLALEKKGVDRRAYFLTDGQVYTSADFSRLLHQELGCPWWIRIKAPLFILRLACMVGDFIGKKTGKISALNNDKYHILKQRNWRCDITSARQHLGYEPQVTLEEGVRRCVVWYKKAGWL